MSDDQRFGRRTTSTPGGAPGPLTAHRFEFRGTGGEFFRIWIVNIALTLVTFSIFSAWAKVRTKRYFYGNTHVAGHSFDYHAPPLRILFGRLIAIALVVGYNLSAALSPVLAAIWGILFAVALPWLVVASLRFNARYSSYRNVRFNFGGTYWGAVKVLLLWPLAAIFTLGALVPLAHRARDYFYVNYHSYGGKPFTTSFSAWDIYKIYLQALLIMFGIGVAMALLGALLMGGFTLTAIAGSDTAIKGVMVVVAAVGAIVLSAVWFTVLAFIMAKTLNLVLNNTTIDARHRLHATLSAGPLVWLAVSNIVLVLLTLGLYYPWARVRYTRYLTDNLTLLAGSNLDEFTSETFAAQSAVGEEIAGIFSLDIGL
uniref:Probable membrane transport protein n=1 Tax=uncultured bacterium BLR9 TaxID=506525 RepID=C0INB4_9BACT|nr:probable membrane transport protein [uncultured bacterium BLR9]